MAFTSGHLTPLTPTLMPTWEMRSATEADCRYLAPRLTQASLAEIDALSKFAPLSVLLQNITRKGVITDRSSPTRPVAIFETTPIEGQRGSAAYWSAMTEDLIASEWFWTFTDHAKAIINQLQRLYPTLITYVDARNVRQIGWLESIGFNHVEDVPQYGRKEMKFTILNRVAE
jgi:hypothetical protein